MIKRNMACLLFLAGVNAVLTAASLPAAEPYRNPNLPIAERIKDLLQRLTLEEKAAQLQQIEVVPWDANPADFSDPSVLQAKLEKALQGRSYGWCFHR